MQMLDQTFEWLNEANWTGPVWITETGWTTPGRQLLPTRIPRPAARNNTELERAMYMVRSYIISIAHGVDRLYWFYFSGDNNFYYSYDMFECDSSDSVMKTVPVYAAMTSRLQGYHFEKALCEGRGGIYVYLFQNGSDRQIIAWNSDTKTSGFWLNEQSETVNQYDTVGNPVPVPEPEKDTRFVPMSGKPIYLELKNCPSAPEVIVPVQIVCEQTGTKIKGSVCISNLFEEVCKATMTITGTDYTTFESEPFEPITLQPGETEKCPFSFQVDREQTAASGDIKASVVLQTTHMKHILNTTHPFLYSQPMPAPRGNLFIEGTDYTSIGFTPSPLWQPNLIRSHSESMLLYRLIPDELPEDAFVEYTVTAKQDGLYKMQLACSPLESGTISRSINNGPEQMHFEQTEPTWIYSTHPANWWRFECAWHDLGTVHLKQGDNTLRINFNRPQERDYGYMALDALSFAVTDQ